MIRKFLYAHRGLHQLPDAPENTMEAFKRAVNGGYGAEFDVHLTGDGKLVVIHDSNLTRLAGREGVVEEMDWEELKTLKILGSQEGIPTFDEVLELFEPSGLPLIIELKHWKSNHLALTKAVLKRLKTYTGEFVLESFNPGIVRDIKKLAPEITRGQLSREFKLDPQTRLPGIVKWCLTKMVFNFLTDPDFIAYKFEDREEPRNRALTGTYTGGRKGGFDLWPATESLRTKPCYTERGKYRIPVAWVIKNQEDLDLCLAEDTIPIFEGFVPPAGT